MSYETIQLEMREAVGIITLNRPASLNALTTEVGQEFQAAVSEVQQRGARAVVLTGAGRAFCAGGERQRFDITCDQCGKTDTVPFKPSTGRPVLCGECFGASRAAQPRT